MGERIDRTQIQVYDADDAIIQILDRAREFGNWSHPIAGIDLELPREQYLPTLKSVQRYLDIAQIRPEIRKLSPSPLPYVEVLESKWADRAHATRGDDYARVHLVDNEWGRREITVIHEFAHVVSASGGHGKAFRDVYIELLGLMMGPEIQLLYRMTLDRIESDPERYEKVD